MMKIKNFFISILTVIFLVMSLNICYAQDVFAGNKYLHNSTFVDNKLYNSVSVENKQYKSGSENYGQVSTLEQLKSLLKAAMENRKTNVVIQYTGLECYDNEENINFDKIKEVIEEIVNKNPYLKYSWTGYKLAASGYYGDLTITFNFGYLTTKVQEEYVDNKVNSIVSQIITDDMNDYQKEKAIHDYIVSHVQYDTSLQEHSAYAALAMGKTVCQGYSLLMFKMLEKAGVKSIIVESDPMNHAWNMVCIDNKWYHVDATWDDPVPDRPNRILYNYYNLTDGEISQPINGEEHIWDMDEYPRASSKYDPSLVYEETPKEEVVNINLSILNNVKLDIKLNENVNMKKVELFDGDEFLTSTEHIEGRIAFIKYKGKLQEKLYKVKVTAEDGRVCFVDVKIKPTLDVVEVDNENKLVKIKSLIDGQLKVNDKYIKNVEKEEIYQFKPGSGPWEKIVTVSVEVIRD